MFQNQVFQIYVFEMAFSTPTLCVLLGWLNSLGSLLQTVLLIVYHFSS